jgi:urocanate hydratase
MNSMVTNPRAAFEFILQVERFYAGLILAAKPGPDAEPSLGGKLLYAGQLNADIRTLLVAGNIAGAASLAVSTDAAGRQAIRDGVVDFLVTSLDEALRILKNEIRKHSTVAVCVALESNVDFALQLLERGVLPDLLPPRSAPTPEFAAFLSHGARPVVAIHPDANQVLLAWSVASAPAQWLPKLDALALDCLSADPSPAVVTPGRRWLRLAPRYVGRMAENLRLMRCDDRAANHFIERVREKVERAEIGVPVYLTLIRNGQPEMFSFAPPAPKVAD